MTGSLLFQHLFRAWSRHWALQVASVTVMTLVLVMLNLLFLVYSTFDRTVDNWGRGLEMTVYFRDGATAEGVAEVRREIEASGQFESVRMTGKDEATRRFLETLGGESLELLADPQWKSPLPASLDLRLSAGFSPASRVDTLRSWSEKLRTMASVDDVFYGQGWVENFARFLGGARWAVVLFWCLSLAVGLMIVGNCIRLSFSQRRQEIEILELVGATARFIRLPFLVEGVMLGLVAACLSLGLSYALHTLLLSGLGDRWEFWLALREVPPMRGWYVVASLASGIGFGALGAWNCVRRLNTGWSAAAG